MTTSTQMDLVRKFISSKKVPKTSSDVAEKLNITVKRAYDYLWTLAQRGELEMYEVEIKGRKKTGFLKANQN